MQSISTIGLDIAKPVFQVHGVQSLGERRQGSQVCIIPGGRYSLACDCRYCFSGGRQRGRSQKFDLGNPSAFYLAMAGVSSSEATKSSGGYSQTVPLESGLGSPRR